MDCKAAGATADVGRAFVCSSSPEEFFSRASLARGTLRRKVESTSVIRIFFMLTSEV
jgi:hypothetical protein